MPEISPRKEFLNYIQDHPEYYSIIQSKIFISVLEFLADKARPLTHIQSDFPEIEPEDIEVIVNSLVKLGLVSKASSADSDLFYTNEEGKMLLEKFKKAEEYFKIA